MLCGVYIYRKYSYASISIFLNRNTLVLPYEVLFLSTLLIKNKPARSRLLLWILARNFKYICTFIKYDFLL